MLKTESIRIPGFENEISVFKIPFDAPGPASGAPPANSKWSRVHFLNVAGDGYGPHAASLGDIATKIPAKPSLKKSCENCRTRPDQDGKGYLVCAACKVSCYCSGECQKSHWKEHKGMCRAWTKHAKLIEDHKAEAALKGATFVTQATLRKWYYDNVDIVDYAIVQTLELYKDRSHSLWRTHAVLFSLDAGDADGTCISSPNQISFDDAEAIPAGTLSDHINISPDYLEALGLGSRVIVIFILDDECDLKLVESHDLPPGQEWAGMEKDEMWRMYIRLRKMALGGRG